VDINETELLQGSRVFALDKNLFFVYGDIFTMETNGIFNTVILASSIQYFPDVKKLINRLFEFLTPTGEIHIVDSPWYTSYKDADDAKERSINYFKFQNAQRMNEKYFHHSLAELTDFRYEVLFNPNSFFEVFKRKFLRMTRPVFPWILIKHH
jgi:hypothetical protein